jgi:hypothetical protein
MKSCGHNGSNQSMKRIPKVFASRLAASNDHDQNPNMLPCRNFCGTAALPSGSA